jgi:HAD superfamily hydrolase (TIGR02253 family)
MIKSVVFDLDNTLIDFAKLKRISIEEAVKDMIEAGLPIARAKGIKLVFELYDKYGWEDNKIFQKFLTKTMGNIDWKILASGIVAYRRVRTGYMESYPHVIPTLLKLKIKGIKLAVVSDAPRLKAYIRLASLKITDYFDVIVTLDDTGKTKPSKEPFLTALKGLETTANETLMVGDWPERDIKGAKSLGMVTCLAKYGQIARTKKSKIMADYSATDISDIVKIIEKSSK